MLRNREEHRIRKTRGDSSRKLAGEWIRKLWYIYSIEYYSTIKNAFESVLMRWMILQPIIQSEVSQKENTDTVY